MNSKGSLRSDIEKDLAKPNLECSLIMTSHFEPRLLSFGGAGIVYQVTYDIVVKRPFAHDYEGILNEYRIYDLLDSKPYCSSVVRSFYRIPSANFLQYLRGGTLDERLRQHQLRDPDSDRVIEVEYREVQSLIWRWMTELTDASAWLESLGFAHGDMRPPNLLLDGNDHLKLIDFDNTTPAGSDCEGCQPPYARLLGDEAGDARGTFGSHGPRTEQFAIGSIFYYMTRGYEPYDNKWFGEDHGNEIVRLLQERQFREVGTNSVDVIIHKCWQGDFELIKSLKIEVLNLGSKIGLEMAKSMSEEEYQTRQRECKELVEAGVLDDTPRGG